MLVHDIMQSPVITVTLRTAASEALGLLRTRGIRHLVVVEGDDVVGHRLGSGHEGDRRAAVHRVGGRLDVVIGPMPTALADIVATVQASGAPVSSIVTLPNPEGVREARGTESFDHVA